MRRTTVTVAAMLSALSLTPAVAADLYVAPAPPPVVYAPPPYPAAVPGYVVWGGWSLYRPHKPYFLVDQGPDYSGPEITVTRLRFVDTDLRRRYPFVGPRRHHRW